MRPISLAEMCVGAYVRALSSLMEALIELDTDEETLEIVRTALGHLIVAWFKLQKKRKDELEVWRKED